MISFKQFLAEQNYPLYHGTNIEGLTAIIRQNKLQSGSYDSPRAHSQSSLMNTKGTISTSRDLKFAKYWSSRITDFNSISGKKHPERTVVIELDREKIRHHHRIIPYNHFVKDARRSYTNRWLFGPQNYKGLDGNQYEERILGSINDVSKYIVKIYLAPEAEEWLKSNSPNLYKKIQKWL